MKNIRIKVDKMIIQETLEEFKNPRDPLVLTIGTFDGVHRGHGVLLKTMKELSRKEGQTVVITFKNHPSEVLRPNNPVPLLCTIPHKLLLLDSYHIDTTILLPFNKFLAQQNAALFVEKIRQTIPFSHLVLGHDATLGRDKQGDRARMLELADEWGFTTIYIEEYRFEAKPVSSSRIREALQQGDLLQVEALLNRPYTIYAPLLKQNGYKLDVSQLCLPPSGVYSIYALIDKKKYDGTATIKSQQHEKSLEVHLNENIKLDQPYLEIEIKALVFNHSNCH